MSTNGCFHFFLLNKEHMVPYPMIKGSLSFTYIKGLASTLHIIDNPNGLAVDKEIRLVNGPVGKS